MNCNQITPLIIEYVDGKLDELQSQAVLKHSKTCNLCKNQIEDERLLQHSLQSLSETEVPVNFCDNVFREIETRQSKRTGFYTGVSTALAASLAFWLVFSPVQQKQIQNIPQHPGIEIAVNNIENIRLAFDAPDDFQQVTLTVKLPEHIELKGLPGKREISWQTSLTSGSNVLTLPVIARRAGEGTVEARISNNQKSKSFKIRMTSKPGDQASLTTSA